MVFISRKEHFSASHTLTSDNLSREQNQKLFGKCSNIHGHNYYLEVTIAGTPDKITGYVFDLKELKDILRTEILDKVDHQDLNTIPMFKGIVPTAENIAIIFYNILEPKLKRPNARLYSVKIYETEKNSVTYIPKSL
ncbi:MAG: 6-pyruvoyl trahydropterin synthase family protein [Ignavibacteria bacterium]